jgi:hypothetical protein
VAEMFAYEASRTFGDRIMRPSARVAFNEKLSYVCQKEFLCGEEWTPQHIEQITLGNYPFREKGQPLKMQSMTSEQQFYEARTAVQKIAKRYICNQLLSILLDAPSGLSDLFRVCRILNIPSQHLIMVGAPGTSKLELVQLAACVQNAPLLEVNAPPFGEPLQFALSVRQTILSILKFNKPCLMVIND